MLGDLKHCTETQLLDYVLSILATPGRGISAWHQTELDQIEVEFNRRHSDIETKQLERAVDVVWSLTDAMKGKRDA